MWRRTWLVGAAALVGIAAARVHAQEADQTLQPVKLSLQPAPAEVDQSGCGGNGDPRNGSVSPEEPLLL